jgi:hypothetical protein
MRNLVLHMNLPIRLVPLSSSRLDDVCRRGNMHSTLLFERYLPSDSSNTLTLVLTMVLKAYGSLEYVAMLQSVRQNLRSDTIETTEAN